MRWFFPLSIASLLVTAPAAAQEGEMPDETRPIGRYAGVEAGEAQPPPAHRRAQRAASRRGVILTWPGFEPRADGSSLFFVQMTQPVPPEVQVLADRIVILFRQTTVHLSNSRRWLETRFFRTQVSRARLERRGRDMALVLHLREPATPRVRTEAAPGGAFHYVYVEFPPSASDRGSPSAPPPSSRPPAAPPPAAPPRELDPSLRAVDEEAPPRR